MKMIGKKLAAYMVAMICLVFISGTFLPLSAAQSADTTPPVTNASIAGTSGSNGWYTTNASVTLTASDSGTGVSSTLCSLDSNPYTAYTSALTITEGKHTLLYYSIDNAGNKEAPQLLNINVDTQKPVTNILIKGIQSSVAGWYNGSVSVNMTTSDATSGVGQTAYSIDSGPWTIYTGNITIGDRAHTFAYGSVDRAGNAYNNSTTINVSDPQITVAVSGVKNNDVWYNSDVTVSFVYDPYSGDGGINHVEYSFNKTAWISGNIFTLSDEGWHPFYYRVVDNGGIVSGIRTSGVGIDKTPPTIGMSIDGNLDKGKGWYTGDVTVHVNANDAGIAYLTQYSWDNKNWNTYNGPFKVSKGSSRTIYYRTFDSANRMAQGSTFIYFAPGSYDQGGMSNQVYINGATAGPSTGAGTATAVPIPSTVPIPTPTQIPMPTPTPVPADAGNTQASGSGAPLAIAVLVGVLVLLGIIAAAAYLFVFKPK